MIGSLGITTTTILLLSITTNTLITATEILEGPLSVNTTLNATANFSCLTEGMLTGLVWIADNVIEVNNPQLYDLGNDRTLSCFQLFAAMHRNGSLIKCVATAGQVNIYSEDAILLIQGILDPPEWIDVKVINLYFSLQWSQPYSLQNVPINNYHIIIMTGNNTVNEDIIINNDTNSIVIANITNQDCYDYNIHISATNDAGESESNVYTLFHPGVPDIINITSSLQHYSNSPSTIVLQLSSMILFKCEEVPSFSVDYIIQSLFHTASYTITTNGSDTDNISSVTFDNVMGNNYYHVDVIVRYVDGEVLIENITQISSYDTQDIEIGRSTTNKLCLRCFFIIDSLSKGCLLHVTNNESISTVPLVSELTAGTNISNWVCTPYTIAEQDGSYTITVFDIESDQTTTKVAPINRIFDSNQFSLLPTVINDLQPINTMSSNNIVSDSISTFTTSTISISSVSISSVSTSSIVGDETTIQQNTVSITSSSFAVNTTEMIVSITGNSPQDQMIVLITASVIGGSIICVIIIIAVLAILLLLAAKQRKVRKQRRHSNIAMSTNALYSTTVSHIYSEIMSPDTKSYHDDNHSEEENTETAKPWVPNPTYSCVAGQQLPQTVITEKHQLNTIMIDNATTDITEKHQLNTIMIDNDIDYQTTCETNFVTVDCPAYTQTVVTHTTRVIQANDEKHIYEDLTNFK